jgi:hypothetical protein
VGPGGTTLSTKGWTLVLSFVMLLVAPFLGGIRLRSAMRFQNISFTIAGLGMLAGFITMLAVSRSQFETKFNQISGAGATPRSSATPTSSASGLPAPRGRTRCP